MEIIQEYSFILKRFLPKQQKISVITQSRGKVSLFIKNPLACHRLWPGMFICYTLSTKKNRSVPDITNIEILDFFTCNSLKETSWLHHILELCYFFVPLNNPCNEIFLFLAHYFQLFHQISAYPQQHNSFSLISSVKLLTLFDFQPTPLLTQCTSIFDSLVANSIDFNNPQNIESITESLQAIPEKTLRHARLWEVECIKSHPCFASFKTMDILR